jgi:hypothetical protein
VHYLASAFASTTSEYVARKAGWEVLSTITYTDDEGPDYRFSPEEYEEKREVFEKYFKDQTPTCKFMIKRLLKPAEDGAASKKEDEK